MPDDMTAASYQRMLMEQRNFCQEERRKDTQALKQEVQSGVKSFHEALRAHREEVREDRQEDKQTLKDVVHDLKETIGFVDKKVETQGKTVTQMLVSVGRNTSWRKWLMGIVTALIVLTVGGLGTVVWYLVTKG